MSTSASVPPGDRLRIFVRELAGLCDAHLPEPDMLREARARMAQLVSQDDWLPDVFAQPDATYYQQYLLYGDPHDRFSVVCFVWGPGQRTPIHDHQVWGVIGMLRGAETSQSYAWRDGVLEPLGGLQTLQPGDVEMVSPDIGDIHQVANAFDDQVSISIHAYGGNIGRISRHVFQESGVRKPFISGYASAVVPNLWAAV